MFSLLSISIFKQFISSNYLRNFPPLPPDPLPISFLEEAAAIAAIEDGVNTAAPAPVGRIKLLQ